MYLYTPLSILSACILAPVVANGSTTWTLGNVDTDCEAACKASGGLCDESAWPASLEQWKAIAEETYGLSCRGHGAGTWKYNPAICTGHGCEGFCFWRGEGQRCSGGTAAHPSPIAKRACPCKKTEAEAPKFVVSSAGTSPIFSMLEERHFQGVGQCFDADASGIRDLPLAGSSYTIEAWVQPEEVKPSESFGIVGWGTPGYSQLNGLIFFRGSDSLRNIWWQNDLQAYLKKPLADGTYHHVAATWDGSTHKLFVDFNEVASRKAHDYNVQSKVNFCVGVAWHQDGSRAHFKGKIKGLKIWNIARKFGPDTETEPKSSTSVAASKASMDVSKVSNPSSTEPESSTFVPASTASSQLFMIDSFERVETRVFFRFEPPTNGCYMVEERHPHVDSQTSVPLAVDFCKGLQAHGEVDYADGRHGQWNYLASLSFYNGFPSGVSVPQGLAEGRSDDFAFRFSYLGQSCDSSEAEVHHAQLEVNADLANEHGRIVGFKASLERLLTSTLELAPGRLSVTHVTSALIVADIMVRPAGASYGRGRRLSGQDTAAEIVSQLRAKLQTDASGEPSALSTSICKLAGATTECAATVKAHGTMLPQVHIGAKAPRGSARNAELTMVVILTLISAAMVLCGILSVVAFWRRQVRQRVARSLSATGGKDQSQPTHDFIGCLSEEKMEKGEKSFDETSSTSTATPESLEESLQDTKDLESSCEVTTDLVAI